MASIDQACTDLLQATTYLIPDWVRVRSESFGLLFYDTHSTSLTFVRSGDMLEPPAFAGRGRVLRVLPLRAEQRQVVGRLLDSLAAKGLIVASEAE